MFNDEESKSDELTEEKEADKTDKAAPPKATPSPRAKGPVWKKGKDGRIVAS